MSGKQPNGLKRERHRWKMSLLESHPDIAVEAHGWNPLDFTAGSKKVKEWCCKECGRIWEATVSARAINNGLGARYCPDCPRIIKGSISLLNSYPEIASEAYGWDPQFVTSHNGQAKDWKCNTCGHIWPTQVSHRTDLGSGCPKCLGLQIDSLKVTYPDIAKEANGWDAEDYTSGSSTILPWKCSVCKHKWAASPVQRIKSPLKWGCSKCNKNAGQVRSDINGQKFRIPIETKSLLFRFPELATELVDPTLASLLSYGTRAKVLWDCSVCKNIWPASVHSRTTHKTRCPDCSKTGFDQKSIGYIYFLQAERNGEIIIQYGITNHLKKRLSYHKRNGFTSESNSAFLECQSGQDALKIENLIKNRLISNGIPSISSNPKIQDKFPGYTESFLKSHLRVDSLKSLLDTLEIDVPLSKGIWIKYS